jgi:hypothetical protein
LTAHLVAPEELIASTILQTLPDVQELGDSMVPDMFCMLLGFVPGERGSKRQKTHRFKGLRKSPVGRKGN